MSGFTRVEGEERRKYSIITIKEGRKNIFYYSRAANFVRNETGRKDQAHTL